MKWIGVAALASLAVITAYGAPQTGTGALDYKPGELLVKFHAGVGAGRRDAILTNQAAHRQRHFQSLDVDHVLLAAGSTVASAMTAFRTMPEVEAVQPNFVRQIVQSIPPPPGPPNDPYWLNGSMYGPHIIQADQVWDTLHDTGDGSVVIADIDTGIDYTHPDLAANAWTNPGSIPGDTCSAGSHGLNVVVGAANPCDPKDDNGHGTHTAGTLAAVGNNGIGVVGINWNAKVLSCKFLDSSGSGSDAGATECFDYIVTLQQGGVNIRVTNNSWGGARGTGGVPTVLQSAIDAAGNQNILNVFAAGNSDTNIDVTPFDPASLSLSSPSVLAVAASDWTDAEASFSNYGPSSVGLAAPGVQIISTYQGGYAYLSGTSMATPHVAGTAALLSFIDPSLLVGSLKAILLNTVDVLPQWNGRVSSGGRLNAYKAALAAGVTHPPTVSITSPTSGTTYPAPATVPITVNATESGGTVASVAFFANGGSIGTSSTAPFSFTWTHVAAGIYTLTAVATDTLGRPGAASSGVAISVGQLPTVSITGPTSGTTYAAPATVPITVTASESGGTVASVAFFANGGSIGTSTTAPFSFTWTNVAVGSYTLTAVATDTMGRAGAVSPGVAITVNPRPTVSITSPTGGTIYTAPATVPITVSASEPGGTVASVAFFANGGSIGTSTTAPFSFTWTSVAAGSYTLTAVATDTMGRAGAASSGVPITVNPAGGTPVNVALAANGATAVASSTYSANYAPADAILGNRAGLNWGSGGGWNDGTPNVWPDWLEVDFAATDTIGEVDVFTVQDTYLAPSPPTPTMTFSLYGLQNFEVQYWTGSAWADVPGGAIVNNDLVWRQVTFAPLATSKIRIWVTSALGTWSRITDVEAWTVSGTPPPPTVSITGPTGGTIYTAPATVPITVSASEPGGTVASVAFFANGGSIGTSTTAPFSFTWTSVAAGSYTLTAVATDTMGRAGAASSGVPITVNPAGGTPVNVALAANGATAVASSTYSANYAPADAILGNRAGLNWGSGGGWNDGTPNVWPDWLEVDFAATDTIGEVDVFTVQDTYLAPSPPTPTMTFSLYGLQNFEVQYWTGSAWADVPGGAIVNNDLVWRQVTFAPLATSKIRIWVTSALGTWSRITDVEAWTVSGTPPPPTVSITGPTGGTIYTAPATVPITVSASEPGGTVASVAFFANGGSIGTSTTAPFSFTWTSVAAGSYTLTAVATDTMGRAGAASSGVPITVNPAGGTPVNVALAANGATAVASSTYSANYAPADAILGNRAGLNWGSGGGWNDGTPNVWPDWLEVDFAATDTIGEVDVFTVQDTYLAPSPPTPTMTFSLYGLQNFEVQYWTGSAWADVPGGAIVNNDLVWRQVTFAPLATSKIRIWVTSALGTWSRITDVEAWTSPPSPDQPSTASVESPLTRRTATPQAAPAPAVDQALGADDGRRIVAPLARTRPGR